MSFGDQMGAWWYRPFAKRRLLDEMIMWRTMGTLISSGVPILQALNITGGTSPRYSGEIKLMHDLIKEGERIVTPLERCDNSFHPFALPMIDVGEETGALPDMLLKIGDVIDSDLECGINMRGWNWLQSDLMQKYVFIHGCGVMTDSGLPLVATLNKLAKVSYLSGMRDSIIKIRDGIENGATFSEAMAGFGDKYFNDVDINMVKAGEAGGVLDVTLGRLAEYTRRRYVTHR